MKFKIFTPPEILRPHIRSFAIQEAANEAVYKVLPDISPVIGFQYKGRLSWLQRNQEIPLASSGITGLRDHYRLFKNSCDIGTVLVFFKEGGAAAFFRQPLHELFRESISLDNLLPRSEICRVEEQLNEATSDSTRINVIEKFLIARLLPREQDALVSAALRLIHQSKGNIRITELTERLHTSRSPLEKRFRKIVGAPPKKFASIVRLKQVIESFRPGEHLAGPGHECGFYDQAHFIKQFKLFAGETPEKFFSPIK